MLPCFLWCSAREQVTLGISDCEMGKVPPTIRGNRARPVYTDVRDAPFQIGQVVRVCQLVDQEGEIAALGKQGVVEYFEYSCGCGQSYPRDPLIGVRFPNGDLHELWREELELTAQSRMRKPRVIAAREVLHCGGARTANSSKP